MGLFDDIVCEYPLPDGRDASLYNWQSKSIHCEMEHYIITAEGRLVRVQWEMEDIPGVEPWSPDKPWLPTTRVKEGSRQLIDMNWHGDMDFYDTNTHRVFRRGQPERWASVNDEAPAWLEYWVRFTNGTVQEIVARHQPETEKTYPPKTRMTWAQYQDYRKEARE